MSIKDRVSKLTKLLPAGKKLIIFGLLVGIVFLSILTLSFSYFTTSEFCNVCHSMKGEYKSWEKSSHSKIQCLACHLPEGGGAAMLAWDHVKSGKLVVAEFITGYEKPINPKSEVSKHIENEQCERCHSPETRNFSPSPGLMMTQKKHYRHVEIGLHCTTCHNRITHSAMDTDSDIKYDKGHEGEEFKYVNYMDMKYGCRRCHNFKSPWSTVVDGKKVTAPVGCANCHPKSWKQMPPGHNSDWIKTHKFEAKKLGFTYCLKCHYEGAKFQSDRGRTLCLECHPTSWEELLNKAKPKDSEMLKSKLSIIDKAPVPGLPESAAPKEH